MNTFSFGGCTTDAFVFQRLISLNMTVGEFAVFDKKDPDAQK